jgi:hypothetical protein
MLSNQKTVTLFHKIRCRVAPILKMFSSLVVYPATLVSKTNTRH